MCGMVPQWTEGARGRVLYALHRREGERIETRRSLARWSDGGKQGAKPVSRRLAGE